MAYIRPHLIDLLFLGSFTDSFHRVKRDTYKRKNRKKNCMKMQIFDKNCLPFKNYFCFFPDFPLFCFNDKCARGSEKQQIN